MKEEEKKEKEEKRKEEIREKRIWKNIKNIFNFILNKII